MNIQEAKENYYANGTNKEDSDNYVSELEHQKEEANEFISEIAKMLNISEGVGYDGITLSLDDFYKSIREIKKQNDD